tara:strand:+ start:139 stop:540 length:402 start_codon:yes stop_codon:yes gene_type:complete
MIKLKDLLKESSPGYENRQFGDPLPTLANITKKYQEKNGVVEEDVINEATMKEGTHYIKTDRFGVIRITVEDNVTITDKTTSLLIQINYEGGSAGNLGSFRIEGQTDELSGDLKPKSKAQVKFKKGKAQVTLP